MRRRIKRILLVVAPLTILLVGGLTARWLVHNSAAAKTVAPASTTPPVRIVPSRSQSTRLVLPASGTVVPSRQVALQAQVPGRVVWASGKLRPGGRFRAGELMLKLDARDYRLRVEQRRAALQRAKLALRLEQGRKSVAEREWQLMGKQAASMVRGKDLALREPQLRSAEAEVRAAEASLAQARIDVSRTRLRAPFDVLVRSRAVDRGQLVQPGQTLAQLVLKQAS